MKTKVIFIGEDDNIRNEDYSKYAETFYGELAQQNFYPTNVTMEHDIKNNKITYIFEAEGSFPKLSLDSLVFMNPLLDRPRSLNIKAVREEK